MSLKSCFLGSNLYSKPKKTHTNTTSSLQKKSLFKRYQLSQHGIFPLSSHLASYEELSFAKYNKEVILIIQHELDQIFIKVHKKRLNSGQYRFIEVGTCQKWVPSWIIHESVRLISDCSEFCLCLFGRVFIMNWRINELSFNKRIFLVSRKS